MAVMGMKSAMQTVNHIYNHIKQKYEYIIRRITWMHPGWFLGGWIFFFLLITVALLLRPAIVGIVGGGVSFGGEKIPDETVDEKKWEIILQSIVSVGLVGGIGLLYRYWEEKKRDEQRERELKREQGEKNLEAERARAERELEAERARAEREQEADREKINLQVAFLREFFGSYIQWYHAYKKVRRKFKARSYKDNKELCMERGDYEQLMDELEDCQLKIESLRRQSQARKDLFGRDPRSTKLMERLRCDKDRLRSILREYETGLSTRRNKRIDESILVSPALRAFIEKKKSGEIEQSDDENEQTENMALAPSLILEIIKGRQKALN